MFQNFKNYFFVILVKMGIQKIDHKTWIPIFSGKATKHIATSFLAVALLLVLVHDAYGQAMSSPSYKMESDSLNFGGVRSVSGSYVIEDTFGEVSTGISSSTNYTMLAGYQQMQGVSLVVVPPTDVVMSPAIGGISGGTSNGQAAFKVTTDDAAGYSVTIVASSSPALTGGVDSFADYAPGGANPDFAFATTTATTSLFAFSPKGADVQARFKDDGSTQCGAGSNQTADKCWDGLATTAKTIVSRASANHPSGTVTTLNFRAWSGSNHVQLAGNYVATTTITIVAL